MELISAPEILSGRATSVVDELRKPFPARGGECPELEAILGPSLPPLPSLDFGVPPPQYGGHGDGRGGSEEPAPTAKCDPPLTSGAGYNLPSQPPQRDSSCW